MADPPARDLRAQLLQAEAAHFGKTTGVITSDESTKDDTGGAHKRSLDIDPGHDEDPDAKRRRILEETRDIDADSGGSDDDSSDEERQVISTSPDVPDICSDEEDETAELMRELAKIKRERAEQREREVCFRCFHCQQSIDLCRKPN